MFYVHQPVLDKAIERKHKKRKSYKTPKGHCEEGCIQFMITEMNWSMLLFFVMIITCHSVMDSRNVHHCNQYCIKDSTGTTDIYCINIFLTYYLDNAS